MGARRHKNLGMETKQSKIWINLSLSKSFLNLPLCLSLVGMDLLRQQFPELLISVLVCEGDYLYQFRVEFPYLTMPRQGNNLK